MRFPYRTAEYFDSLVLANEQALEKFRKQQDNPSTTATHRKRLGYSIYQRSTQQVMARYSRGDSVFELQRPFAEAVSALEGYLENKGAKPDDFTYLGQYVTSLRMISLAVLLDVKDANFLDLVNLLGNRDRDRLYERIVAARLKARERAAILLHEDQFGDLSSAFEREGDRQRESLQQFLDGYYRRMSGLSWYDSHQRPDSGFFGYWSFEAAAIAKILQIPTTSFSNHIHYPAGFF